MWVGDAYRLYLGAVWGARGAPSLHAVPSPVEVDGVRCEASRVTYPTRVAGAGAARLRGLGDGAEGA